MHEPILLGQITKELLKKGFKVQRRENEIGSSNDRHREKYYVWQTVLLWRNSDNATAS